MTVGKIRNPEEFKRIIARDVAVVVCFGTPRSDPCKAMSPIFDKLSGHPAYAAVEFYKVNVEEVPIAEPLQINTVPTFLSFRAGDLFGEVTGANPDRLADIVAKASNLHTAARRQ